MLGEGQVIIALLFEAWMVDETLVDVFDVRLPSQTDLPGTNSIGNTHPRRPERPPQRIPNPPPQRTQRRKIPRQTYHQRNLLTLLLPPNRRIRSFPPSKSNTRRGRPLLPHPHRCPRGAFASLSIFQITIAIKKAEE